MRVLIVASYNKHRFAPFIMEQAEALRRSGCEVEFLGVEGKGILGYLKTLPSLKARIRLFSPDVVHAHYGLCGLLSGLQRKVPVVTTYHGSDINLKTVRPFSKLAMALSALNIFVSSKTLNLASPRGKYALLPCGIDLSDEQLTSKDEARRLMDLPMDRRYVLFAGAFDNAVKNYPLAKSAVKLVPETELLELKGYTRSQVTLLMCAADAFLMTSLSEGSPQVIKEAMACGLPIVSVDVGDVAEVTEGIEGCFLCRRDPEAIADAIKEAMSFGRTNGRCRIIERGLDNNIVATRLLSVYKEII